MCIFNTAEEASLEQNEPSSTLKSLICRKFSIQKLTEFSLEHKELDTAACKIDGILWRDT
jgi:hypothetical protein